MKAENIIDHICAVLRMGRTALRLATTNIMFLLMNIEEEWCLILVFFLVCDDKRWNSTWYI